MQRAYLPSWNVHYYMFKWEFNVIIRSNHHFNKNALIQCIGIVTFQICSVSFFFYFWFQYSGGKMAFTWRNCPVILRQCKLYISCKINLSFCLSSDEKSNSSYMYLYLFIKQKFWRFSYMYMVLEFSKLISALTKC